MSLKVTKSHLKISKSSFLCYIFCLTPNLFKTFRNINNIKTQIFHYIKHDLKGHPISYKTIFMPKSF